MAPQAETNVDAKAGRVIHLFDPATGAPRGDFVAASGTEVRKAVARARATFDAGWHNQPENVRLAALIKLSDVLQSESEAFAQLISEEIGAPITNARTQQVQAALSHLDATIAALQNQISDYPVREDERYHRIRHEPMGVAALVTPWNWPLNQIVLKVSAALASGCTMVLKPSELTPRTAELFAKCMDRVGLPNGVFQCVMGDGETGGHLVNDPRVDVISFTGSTAVGREIARIAAQNFIPTILELGGKSPNLVFADCDLETAIKQGVAHCFRNSGQSCNAASRMLVERAVYDKAVAFAKEFALGTHVDLPTKDGRHIGPLVNEAQWVRVQDLIQAGIAQGARLVTGGTANPDHLPNGYFAKPTVFADVRTSMRIAREEIFGPVLVIQPFETEEEAIKLANDTDYGLAAYIQTSDLERADRVAKQLRVGMVQVNGSSRAPGTAFGGVKASGTGREAGLWGIRAYQHVKSISGAPKSQ